MIVFRWKGRIVVAIIDLAPLAVNSQGDLSLVRIRESVDFPKCECQLFQIE